jgi:acrylyl-CoA reductase (NADPH)
MNPFPGFRIHNDGGRVSGRVEELSLDDLSPGEVVMRVVYSSVNYKDALAATGAGKIITHFPRVGGIDASGHVVSSRDARFKEGDAVLVTGYDFGVSHDGGYAEYARVPAEWVVPLPPGLSLRDAMVLGTAGFTVGLAVQRFDDNGQRPDHGPLLVTGATGGVGSIGVNVFAALGYSVTALTGKDDQHDFLRKLGAREILSRHTLEMGERPLEGAQWGGALDTVGGDVLGWITRTTKPWGNIVSCGLVAGSELRTTVMPFILRGVTLIGVTSAGCPSAWRQRVWQRLAGELRPPMLEAIAPREIGLEDLPAVFDAMLKRRTQGRYVVRIGG